MISKSRAPIDEPVVLKLLLLEYRPGPPIPSKHGGLALSFLWPCDWELQRGETYRKLFRSQHFVSVASLEWSPLHRRHTKSYAQKQVSRNRRHAVASCHALRPPFLIRDSGIPIAVIGSIVPISVLPVSLKLG
ncbi:hypothetical protein BST61_g1724 [Cercospora zeina]